MPVPLTQPRRALVCALLLAWLVLTGLLVPAPAHAQEAALSASLESITPKVTESTEQIRVTGRLRNTGDVPLDAVKASFWISTEPMTRRDDLPGAAERSTSSVDGRRVTIPDSLVDDITETLRPGEGRRFAVTVPVERLVEAYGLDTSGVYLVGVDIRGLAPGAYTRQTWRLRTFLPWVFGKTEKLTPVEVAYLVPLTGTPDMVRDDVVLDQDDMHEFAPGGRLSRLLDFGASHDLGFVVDPALLEQAEAVRDGYQVQGLTDSPPRREGSDEAAAWLDKARGLLAAHETLMLPYADPDLPALKRHRMADEFGAAIRAGRASARDLGIPERVLTWPGDGFADAGMLETIAASEGRSVLLRQDALPQLPDDGSSPAVSLVTPAGNLTALVTDPALTAGGPGGNDSPLQMRQRFLAETSLLAMQPGPRTELRRLIAAFPRTWDPGVDGEELFDVIERTSWLRQVSIDAIRSQAPTAYGGPVRYPDAQRKQEIDATIIRQLEDLNESSRTYLDLLADPKQARSELARAFLRGSSTAWRRNEDRGAELVSVMAAHLNDQTRQVEVIAAKTVTLSGQSGRFPITINNGLRESVDVQLEVQPTKPGVVEFEEIQPVEIGPLRKATVGVNANATGSGPMQVKARIHTKDNHTPIDGTTMFQVRVTGYGQVGWAVIGAGVGMLMLVAAFRIVRRIRAARRAAG